MLKNVPAALLMTSSAIQHGNHGHAPAPTQYLLSKTHTRAPTTSKPLSKPARSQPRERIPKPPVRRAADPTPAPIPPGRPRASPPCRSTLDAARGGTTLQKKLGGPSETNQQTEQTSMDIVGIIIGRPVAHIPVAQFPDYGTDVRR